MLTTCFYLIKSFFNPHKARLFKSSFFLEGGGGHNLTPFIFQEELI